MIEKETTLVSSGDFLDLYHKIKQKGLKKLGAILSLSNNRRIAGKWDAYSSGTDYWIIPALNQYWNAKISGDGLMDYETYVAKKYLTQKNNLKMLSVGCGEGIHERNFAQQAHFDEIIGIDLSEQRIQKARRLAKEENLNITYYSKDFRTLNFDPSSFDIILFHASLHHFDKIALFLKNEIKPLLKSDGILVIHEYCGPNRLQWSKRQLEVANQLLQKLPRCYKTLQDGKTLKKKVYRPGLIRMFLVDPSEAPDAKNLHKAVLQNFSALEEAQLGGNILHSLLKGIAHNFVNSDKETSALLTNLIKAEESFIENETTSDSIFGVYKKNEKLIG